MEKIEPEGQANIYDAIAWALGMMGSGKVGRLNPSAADTIYLLTDGHVNSGAITYNSRGICRVSNAWGITIKRQ